jgi:putative Mg2+ transporter-C (MgtC) family protein
MDASWTKGASIGEVAIRLTIAIFVGGLIGFDRQRSEKPAGLRTHMLVALGSASFTLLGFEVGAHLSPRTGVGFDPTRVLQGVIGGIGFLGAGAIIRDHGHVSGITTAASVWVAGALGAAAGVGAYVLALFTTLLAFVILSLLVKLETKISGVPPPRPGGASSHAAPSTSGASSDVPKVGE